MGQEGDESMQCSLPSSRGRGSEASTSGREVLESGRWGTAATTSFFMHPSTMAAAGLRAGDSLSLTGPHSRLVTSYFWRNSMIFFLHVFGRSKNESILSIVGFDVQCHLL